MQGFLLRRKSLQFVITTKLWYCKTSKVVKGNEKFQNQWIFFLSNQKICARSGKFLNALCAWISRTRCTEICASRAQTLVSRNKKTGEKSVFPKKKHTSAYDQQNFECIVFL